MMIVYAHDEYRNMRLTPATCNRRARSAAREYALRHPGLLHPDVNVFQRLEHHFCETRNVTPTAAVNADQ